MSSTTTAPAAAPPPPKDPGASAALSIHNMLTDVEKELDSVFQHARTSVRWSRLFGTFLLALAMQYIGGGSLLGLSDLWAALPAAVYTVIREYFPTVSTSEVNDALGRIWDEWVGPKSTLNVFADFKPTSGPRHAAGSSLPTRPPATPGAPPSASQGSNASPDATTTMTMPTVGYAPLPGAAPQRE